MRRLPSIAFLAVILALSGCHRGTGASANGAPQDTPAVALLKKTMDRYAAFPGYAATCSLTLTPTGHDPVKFDRTLTFARPNQFRVESKGPNGTKQTAICDGQSVLEFENMSGQPPRKQDAPALISDAGTQLMRHPMFCGSLLYQFFGGSFYYDGLVDDTHGQPTLAGTQSVNGETADVVKFYGQQAYGHVEVVIGQKTGFVYKIKYDSEPMFQSIQAHRQQIADAAAKSTDPAAKARAQAMTAAAETTFVSEEVYSNVQTNPTLGKTVFALIPPPGTKPMELGSYGLPPRPPVPYGSPAPDFTVTTLDGKSQKLSDFKGHPVLLDFWATWCGPCVASLPHTQDIYAKGKAKGLQVLAISREDSSVVSRFITDKKFTFPVGVDSTSTASMAYRTDAIPTTVVVDAQGRLVAYIVGGGQDEAIAKALKRVGIAGS